MSKLALYTTPILKPERHNLTGGAEYNAWRDIKKRCFNANHKYYSNYGGRGITMYEPWITSFLEFYRHVGKRPTKYHSIDRIDNDGNYEPGNIKWSIKTEQDNNRRTNVFIYIDDSQKTIAQIARDNNIKPDLLRYYYKKFGDIIPALNYMRDKV